MNKKTIFGLCAAGLLLVSGMTLSGCADSSGPGLLTPETPLSRSDFLLNTFVTITLYDSDDSSILDDSMALCKEYENIFSKTLETSELYKINHRTSDTVTVSDDMAALLAKGLEYCEKSDGAFDITIEPLSSLWNFTSGEAVIPDEADIEADIPKVDYHNLVLSGNTLTFLSPDTTIDLGSIAKGYIADRVTAFLEEKDVRSAIVDLGGNIVALGGKARSMLDTEAGETDFRIGIKDPQSEGGALLGTLPASNLTVVTSGTYERYFIADGKKYHHILDSETGYPTDTDVLSATIIAAKGRSVDCDGLSTTCLALGIENALALVNSIEGVEAILVDKDGKVHQTSKAISFTKA